MKLECMSVSSREFKSQPDRTAGGRNEGGGGDRTTHERRENKFNATQTAPENSTLKPREIQSRFRNVLLEAHTKSLLRKGGKEKRCG